VSGETGASSRLVYDANGVAEKTMPARLPVHALVPMPDDRVHGVIAEKHFSQYSCALLQPWWPAPGSEDTELGVILEPEVVYGTQTLCTRVQA